MQQGFDANESDRRGAACRRGAGTGARARTISRSACSRSAANTARAAVAVDDDCGGV